VCLLHGTNCIFKYVQFRLNLVPTYVWFVEDQVTLDCFRVGTAWNASRVTGLPWLGIRSWDTKGPSEGLDASGPKRL